MRKGRLIFKIYREIHALEPRALPAAALQAAAVAVQPFVNILFSARLIERLTAGASFRALLPLLVLALAVNLILFFLSAFLEDYSENQRRLLLSKENRRIADKLFGADCRTLEDPDFRTLLHKHTEAEQSRWARFPYFVWTTFRFLSGLFTFSISLVLLFPLLRLGFRTTGESFFERPVFLAALLGVILAMAGVILALAAHINKSYLKANEAYAELDRVFYCFLEVFGDYRTGKEIRLYKEQPLIDRLATTAILTDGEATLRRVSLHTAKTSSFVAVLGALAGFGVYWFIGVKGLLGLFPAHALVLYCGAFLQIINGIMMMANTFGKLREILPLSRIYFEILETKAQMTYGTRTFAGGAAEIEFRDVSFRYPNTASYALRHVNLTLHAGESLAAVGRNGSGKTTFVKLLCRLYDPTEGVVLLNGHPLPEYTKESLEALYAVVFQDYTVFAVPLADNVAASETADRARLLDALEKANLLSRVQTLPNAERTCMTKTLDEAGVELSGGEAQKLALARALYKDAPVVALDEPTAALDPKAEAEIYRRFHTYVAGKTAVYISHRLSGCAFCDRIAVFDAGALCELGTHRDLLRQNGKYAALWNAQAQYYLDDNTHGKPD